MRRSPLGLTSVRSREKVPPVGDGMGRSIVSHNLVHLPVRKGSQARELSIVCTTEYTHI